MQLPIVPKYPPAHSVHDAAPRLLHVPVAQLRQDDDPEVGAYLPAAHAVHEVELTALKEPSGQMVQLLQDEELTLKPA